MLVSQEDITDVAEDATTVGDVVRDVVDWFVGPPLTIIAVILGALIVRRYGKRAIHRGLLRAADLADDDPRAQSRARTISVVLTSLLSVVVWSLMVLLILGELGVNLAPLIAGAGIVGVAVGFGGQSLVKDCISGLFMLLEDQYGVGDVVDVGEASGSVEAITLRITRLRSVDGTVWHVPNGEIRRVGNMSQLWSVALLDVDIAYDADVEQAAGIMTEAANRVAAREEFAAFVMDPPEFVGLEALGADGLRLRLRVKTQPGQQWALQRALRTEVKRAFDEAGIEIPFPQRTVWLRRDQP